MWTRGNNNVGEGAKQQELKKEQTIQAMQFGEE